MIKGISGSRMVMEALREEGVETVFGYPGGAALNIYDETYKQSYFRHVLTRHEQAAVHAADGYARASGKVGVAFVTSGPGFTNAVTGLATAYSDSIPLILISGQVPTSLIGTDAFQEIDAVGISRPCVKHNYLVRSIEELPRILKEAFYIARSGRPGPVHVDIPKDITAAVGDFDYPTEIKMPTYKPTYKGNAKQIKKALEVIAEAKRPLLYLGGGVVAANASELVRKFSAKTGIPAVETLMGLGVLAHEDKNLLSMVGMHGSYAANMAMSETDLIIALGVRFDDRVTGKLSEFAKHAKIIHVDIDPSSISKIVNAHFPIVGDLNCVLEEMLEKVTVNEQNLTAWREILARYDALNPLDYKDSDEIIKPQWVVRETAKILKEFNNYNELESNYMSENFSNTYFSKKVCSKIGYIRENIENKFKNGEINERERAILITSLLYAMDKIAATCGHYDAYRKGAILTDNITLAIPLVNSKNNPKNRCFNEDANKLARQISADLVYIDPPYNSRQYSDSYHLLENVATWQKPKVSGVAKKMDRLAIKSQYCGANANEAFADLIENTQAKYILFSYNNMANKGNDRSNAKISDEVIMDTLGKKGKVLVFLQKYKAFSTGKSEIKDNAERLFLCEVS